MARAILFVTVIHNDPKLSNRWLVTRNINRRSGSLSQSFIMTWNINRWSVSFIYIMITMARINSWQPLYVICNALSNMRYISITVHNSLFSVHLSGISCILSYYHVTSYCTCIINIFQRSWQSHIRHHIHIGQHLIIYGFKCIHSSCQ